LNRIEAKASIYHGIDELPEVLEPSRYIAERHVIEIYEHVPREEIAYQLRVQRATKGTNRLVPPTTYIYLLTSLIPWNEVGHAGR
jgi:hypothetical protein